MSGSPVQTDKSVIVLFDDEGPSYLVAFNKADGQIAWKTDRLAAAVGAVQPADYRWPTTVVISSAGTSMATTLLPASCYGPAMKLAATQPRLRCPLVPINFW